MSPYQRYVGRTFGTRYVETDEAVWGPLERVALLSRTSEELPSLHVGEFMYMAWLRNDRKNLDIHLYKHYDTRCYINLASDGHAYAYCPRADDDIDDRGGGRYRRYHSLRTAIGRLELSHFDDDPPLYRSFPPGAWPPDIAGNQLAL